MLSDLLLSDLDWVGCIVFIDVCLVRIVVFVEELWCVIFGIGGENGWYFLFLLWVI